MSLTFALLLLSATALAQTAPPAPPPNPAPTSAEEPRSGEVAISPTRFELPMSPGEEKTVVINVISGAGGSGSTPRQMRLLSSLGDWTLSETGEVGFAKAATTDRSAVPWMTYSPVELVVEQGQTHSIRVTVAVPEDAPPGDHRAVLFIQERPKDNKTKRNAKQLLFNFRLAAIFYVMVSPLERKGELVGLKTDVEGGSVFLTSELKNLGNTHLRPMESFQIVDKDGKVVLDRPEAERLPILAGGISKDRRKVAEGLAPGEYSVRYRINFDSGGKITEGRTRLIVPVTTAPAPAPQQAVPEKTPAGKKPAEKKNR